MMEAMKVLAVDYGTKRTGVAVSDEGGSFARPLATLLESDPARLLAALARLLAEHRPAAVIVGNPRRLDGTAGTHADAVVRLADGLRALPEAAGVSVQLRDEALTTAEAHSRMLESGAGRHRRKEAIDRVAAAVLLQDFLDARRLGGT
jgi:putative Holliday junction resolvase